MRQGCPPASGLQGSFRVFFQTVSNTNEFFHLWPTYSVIGYLLLTFFISWPQYSVIGYVLLTFFISGLTMSGSHQIRHDRMNDGLFRHWTKLPSQILAEPVQDMDEILDSSTNSLMESDQDDDEDTKQNKLPSQILAEAVQDTDEILDFPTDSSKLI